MDRFPNLLFAKVVSNEDEEGLGRVQVEVFGYGAKLKLPWLRTLQGLAGKDHGTLVLPEVGDEVVVLCGAGTEADGMIVLGGVYNSETKQKLPKKGAKNALKQVMTKGGHRVTLDDSKGKEIIEVAAGKKEKIKITMTVADGILLLAADKDIQVKGEANVTVDAKDTVTVKAAKKLVVDAKDVTLKMSGKCVIEGGDVTVDGDNVTLKASKNCTVQASGNVTIKGKAVSIG